MLSCCRAVLAAPARAITGREASTTTGRGEQTKQTAAQREAALNAFDRLRVREVDSGYEGELSTFLARFQSTAAELDPDERIKLVVCASAELLKAVLVHPMADKICALHWVYNYKEDVNSIVALLMNSCPELASLEVDFELDFVSSVLEHPKNKIKVLDLLWYPKGNISRFFAALGKSQVSALAIYNNSFARGLCTYLARDLLVRLKVGMDHKQVPLKMMASLAKCTCLTELVMLECEFSWPNALIHLPKSITRLMLFDCTFVDGFDWSFLADSNVRELYFHDVRGVDGHHLGGALAVRLRKKGLDWLYLDRCDFANEALAAVGVELARIKSLHFESRGSDVSFEQIALAMQSPSSAMKELSLTYNDDTMSGIENHLVPALRHPNCNLNKLSFSAYQEHEAAAETVETTFHNRRALFVLLQGQQVRRRYCPLRRLPVEMFRMVGEVLL